MTDLDGLWLRALEDVSKRAAHEVKDALNGVSLNLEVIRSRTSTAAPGAERAGGGTASRLTPFVAAAGDQLELVVARTEALLFLARSASEPCDVALTLRHLASLMVPAIKSDGGQLTVEGCSGAILTTAQAQATRLALAAGLLALARNGAGSAVRCRLEQGSDTVVRFSHESAVSCNLDAAVASAIARHGIRNEVSGTDLILRFPGHF
ncbi:MAG TPA: hypothetical protein VFT29_11820 [Gemmatimonadaceae bacterium]|nr:hypothetical protein [Gemmatimonadaceae bacterium]